MGAQFLIYSSKRDAFWLGPNNLPVIYETQEEASKFLEQLYRAGHMDYSLRKAYGEIDMNWSVKARSEVATLDKKQRPDYIAQVEAKREHCLRINPDGSGTLLFFKDFLAGAAGRLSTISMRGYLEKHRKMGVGEIDLYERLHKFETSGADGLMFASTPQEIASAYTNVDPALVVMSGGVAHSCMRHSVEHFKTPTHPCSVYGAGDLAVAYLLSDQGRVTARALCWPNRKIYSRVYAPNDMLHRALKKRGFNKSAVYYGDAERNNRGLEGARLLCVPHPDPKVRAWVMPYIDEGMGVRRERIEGTDYFLLTRSDTDPSISVRQTNGWSCESPHRIVPCPLCGADIAGGGYWRCFDANYEEVRVCRGCASLTYQCAATGQYFLTDRAPFETIDGNKVSQWAIQQGEHYVAVCHLSGRRKLVGSMIRAFIAEPFTQENSRLIAREEVAAHCWRDCLSGDLILNAVPSTEVYYNRAWLKTARIQHARWGVFESAYNGKLYTSDYRRPVAGPNGRMYAVASVHLMRARARLNSGKTLWSDRQNEEAAHEIEREDCEKSEVQAASELPPEPSIASQASLSAMTAAQAADQAQGYGAQAQGYGAGGGLVVGETAYFTNPIPNSYIFAGVTLRRG